MLLSDAGIMKNIYKHRNILEVLSKASPALRKAILQHADKSTICILAEIIVNLMQGHLNLSQSQKKKLKPYKRQFQRLVAICHRRKHINKIKTRRVLLQSGGALPFLLPLLIPLIAKAALGGAVAAGAGIATRKIIGQ